MTRHIWKVFSIERAPLQDVLTHYTLVSNGTLNEYGSPVEAQQWIEENGVRNVEYTVLEVITRR